MKHCCTFLVCFLLMVSALPTEAAEPLRIHTSVAVACQKFEIFERSHELFLAKEYAAAVAVIPSPPECIDLVEGQTVAGPIEERTENQMRINYTKVLIGERAYWVMSSHLDR